MLTLQQKLSTTMKKIFSLLLSALLLTSFASCGDDEPAKSEVETPDNPGQETPDVPSDGKILVAYFSWGGTTRCMATQIAEQTGGTLFEIVPVNPYPTEYTPCTQVALEERDSDARPAIRDRVGNMDEYDIIFIGCPVWWHTAPMIISTFTESYDLRDKTVVPFCTYASTYRDETLQKIVSLTPDSHHLSGLGLRSGEAGNTSDIASWLKSINVIR